MNTTHTQWWVAISFDCWGRGRSIEEARRELLLAGGDPATHLVYRIDVPAGQPPPHVDAGRLVFHGTIALVAATKNGTPIDPATLDRP